MPNDGQTAGTAPPSAIEHFFPGNVPRDNVELSIIVPALNEEITVGEFIDWCKEGLKRAGVNGQVLIVDSSTDDTARIVLEHGGEVLRTPKRGLGRAYIDAIPYIRGKWIVMGDADLTYDFRELTPFVEEFRKGAEFVMGSRFRGSIEKGAMPGLHRYFGTPLDDLDSQSHLSRATTRIFIAGCADLPGPPWRKSILSRSPGSMPARWS